MVWLAICCFLIAVAIVLGVVIGGCVGQDAPFRNQPYCLAMTGNHTLMKTWSSN
jgi:hypothetical protein